MPASHLSHLVPLFVATTTSIGGRLPLHSSAAAIRSFGLPERIASSPEAQTAFIIYGSRISVWGAAVWIFYLQGKLEAVDTMLSLVLYMGAVDGYVAWKEGVLGTAVGRVFASLLFGAWGVLGLTVRWGR